MTAIHEISTLTSKGQITLPKSVRQLLGIDTGCKIAFDVRGGEIVVSRVETTHEDPAIVAFLGLLEDGIRSGRNLTTLPEDLAQTMLAHANHPVNLDEDIDGEIAPLMLLNGWVVSPLSSG
ncbi:AbrB/MazE/SpoVT family DNA-binding domain-containing protein [Pseudomonas sp. S60]|uniref:type II toxin-antitoxin system PrlF family antitoxin n=1 Tax=Pseudomonas sp. S60 TaxID=211124 RepID=UPI0019120CA3|nr:type II toxin-antitoxin system PrlF family antitoxin [Pseudomonas sp. S60]MBK5009834.1 AbrB/MazE/SpoVT family DNA-binding domain-containing protein [Pseudomonas sp. S60]